MITRWAAAASGLALLAVGWAVGGGVWAAVAAVAGVLALAAVAARRAWAGAAVLVATAFIAEVALAEDPNWPLVLVGVVLLACFLALGELHENGVNIEAPQALRPHVVPVLMGVGAAVLAIVASVLPLEGELSLVALAVAAAACVGLLVLAAAQN